MQFRAHLCSVLRFNVVWTAMNCVLLTSFPFAATAIEMALQVGSASALMTIIDVLSFFC